MTPKNITVGDCRIVLDEGILQFARGKATSGPAIPLGDVAARAVEALIVEVERLRSVPQHQGGPGGASWCLDDPRPFIGTSAKIVIVTAQGEAFFGAVETNHGWYVQVVGSGNDRDRFLGEKDAWPQGWRWVHRG